MNRHAGKSEEDPSTCAREGGIPFLSIRIIRPGMKWNLPVIRTSNRTKMWLKTCLKLLVFGMGLSVMPSAFAQPQPPECDTLVLTNKRILFVRLDSLTEDRVFYYPCHSGQDNIKSLPLTYIRYVGRRTGARESWTSDEKVSGYTGSYADYRSVGWHVQKRHDKGVYILAPDREVQLTIRNGGKSRKWDCRILEIREREVLIQPSTGVIYSVPKDQVSRLKLEDRSARPRPDGRQWLTSLLWASLVTAGLFLLAGMVLGDGPLSLLDLGNMTGVFLGVVLVLTIIIFLIKVNRPATLDMPFGDQWEWKEDVKTGQTESPAMMKPESKFP